MGLTVSQLIEHARHTLGGDASADIGGCMSIVNTAGRLLHSMHPWKTANRASTTLDFTASQSYIGLPSDFGDVIAVQSTNALVRNVKLTTLDTLLQFRTTQVIGDVAGYYLAVNYHSTSTNNYIPSPQFEIWPTPSTSSSAALTLFYRAKWVNVTADDDIVRVPDWQETLLIELVRAVARGWEMEEEGVLQDRISAVMGGPIALAAMRIDGDSQPNLGELRGGAVGYSVPYMGWDQYTYTL